MISDNSFFKVTLLFGFFLGYCFVPMFALLPVIGVLAVLVSHPLLGCVLVGLCVVIAIAVRDLHRRELKPAIRLPR